MRSPLHWQGGKSRLAALITSLLPAHDHYGEPFAGAGWVYFNKPPSKSESLNDINGDLVAFYRVLQHHLEEFVRQFRWVLVSREGFTNALQQLDAGGLTDIQRAARFYLVQRSAFGGKVHGRTFGVDPGAPPPVNLLRIEEELSAVHLRLAGTVIENLPWREYLQRYDRQGTVFYLDPPYWGCEMDYGPGLFKREDFQDMAGILANLRGKFLLSLNDVPGVQETFRDFEVREVRTKYSCGTEGRHKQARELVFSNFTPGGGLLDFMV